MIKTIQKLIIISLVATAGGIPLADVSAATFGESFQEVSEFAVRAKVNVPASEVDFVIRILNILLGITAIIAVVALVYAAFLMITHMGEEDDVKKAKNIIKYAILGLILIGLSAVIVNVIVNVIIKPQG